MYGQQSLTPPVGAVTSGFGGGQLIEAALTVLVRAAAWGQAAVGPAVSATASTTGPAGLAGGRGAGRASLSRWGCLVRVGFLLLPDCADWCMPCTREQASSQGRRRMSPYAVLGTAGETAQQCH